MGNPTKKYLSGASFGNTLHGEVGFLYTVTEKSDTIVYVIDFINS